MKTKDLAPEILAEIGLAPGPVSPPPDIDIPPTHQSTSRPHPAAPRVPQPGSPPTGLAGVTPGRPSFLERDAA